MPKKSSNVKLNIHSTYILPTRYGALFSIILYAMLMGSINYSNSMGFLLTFLLAGIGLVGMIFTFRNLINIRISAGKTDPVFAGEEALFNFWLETTNYQPAHVIRTGITRHKPNKTGISIKQKQLLQIPVTTTHRGLLPPGRLRIWSEFPFGLFQVWSWLELDTSVLVYPKPSGKKHLQISSSGGQAKRITAVAGHEDFAGVRRYHLGDSPQHIAWKAVARGHDILTKQFSESAGGDIWLDWNMLPDMDREQRLSQLCQWILDLHRQDCRYGLKLPGYQLEPGHGELHKHNCLQQLALFKH